MQDALIGGHNKCLTGPIDHRLDHSTGGAHHIGQFNHRRRTLRVHQHLGMRILLLECLELDRLELIVNNAVAFPEHHVGPGLVSNVATQVPIGCKQNLLTPLVQLMNNGQCTATGHHPIGPRLHRCTGVGIDHHRAVGVRIAEGCKVIGWAAQIQGASGL